MDRPRTVMIVASDEDLRRSIVFALEAEGLPVESMAALTGVPSGDGFGCFVIDEKTLKAEGRSEPVPQTGATPVVLLVEKLPARQQALGMSVVDKPLLGPALVDAVLAAMAGQAGVAPT